MGVCTVARLKGHITYQDVLAFIVEKIDNGATANIDWRDEESMRQFAVSVFDNDSPLWCESGFIGMKDHSHDEFRSMFYLYRSYCTPDITYEHTYISLGHSPFAISTIRSIVEHFGGEFCENDCSSDWEPVIKNPDGSIKPVIHVTMQDIYAKFGGIVIIDDIKH